MAAVGQASGSSATASAAVSQRTSRPSRRCIVDPLAASALVVVGDGEDQVAELAEAGVGADAGRPGRCRSRSSSARGRPSPASRPGPGRSRRPASWRPARPARVRGRRPARPVCLREVRRPAADRAGADDDEIGALGRVTATSPPAGPDEIGRSADRAPASRVDATRAAQPSRAAASTQIATTPSRRAGDRSAGGGRSRRRPRDRRLGLGRPPQRRSRCHSRDDRHGTRGPSPSRRSSASDRSAVLSQRGQAARAARPARASPRSNEETTRVRGPVRGPPARTSTAPRPGSPFSSTSRNARRGRAASDVVERRHADAARGRRPSGRRPARRALDRDQRLVMEHDGTPSAARADVELEAVAARERRAPPGTPRVVFSGARRQSPRCARRSGHRPAVLTRSRGGRTMPEVVARDRASASAGSRTVEGQPRRRRHAIAPADPDVVEAARLAVGVHRRRLQPGRPGDGRVLAVRLGVGRPEAGGTHPAIRRLRRLGIEVADDDLRVGRRGGIEPVERAAAACSSRSASSGRHVVEVGDRDEDASTPPGSRSDDPDAPSGCSPRSTRSPRRRPTSGSRTSRALPYSGRPAQPRTARSGPPRPPRSAGPAA